MNQVINLLPNNKEICLLIKGAFSKAFCTTQIKKHRPNFKVAKTHYPTSYRNNERQLVDDDKLAYQLFESIKLFIPNKIFTEGKGKDEAGEWHLKKLNTRIRFCRYLPKQYFNKHLDGIHYESRYVQSKLTFMIYLNGHAEFTGGRTLFFPSKEDDSISESYVPSQGDLIIFDHNLWHSGEAVLSGEKYILRSDILYELASTKSVITEDAFGEGHLGYIWVITHFRNFILSSGRDKKIKIWSREGEKMGELIGHNNSILSLLSLSDELLVSASRDQTVKIWHYDGRFQEKKQVSVFSSAVLDLCRIDENQFATSDGDGNISGFDSSGNLLFQMEAHEDWIWKISMLKTTKMVSISEDGILKIWDITTQELFIEWRHTVPLNSLKIETKSKYIFVGTFEGEVLKFRFDSKKNCLTLVKKIQAHSGIIRCLELHDKYLVSAGEDSRVKVWDQSNWQVIWEYQHDNFVQDVLVTDESLISVAYDGRITEHKNHIIVR